MLKRDYLIKQFEEFGKVLAVLMGLKRDGKLPEFTSSVNDTAHKYTGLELTEAEKLPDDRLIAVLTGERKLSDEQLKMIADLLYAKADTYAGDSDEDKTKNAYRKALIVYQFIQASTILPYSLDTHYKLEFLKQYFSEAG